MSGGLRSKLSLQPILPGPLGVCKELWERDFLLKFLATLPKDLTINKLVMFLVLEIPQFQLIPSKPGIASCSKRDKTVEQQENAGKSVLS